MNRTVTLFLLVALLGPNSVTAQDDENDEELRQGLLGRYQVTDGLPIQRVDTRIAFGWADAIPDRRLENKDFSVTWNGYLMSQAPGDYKLYVHAAGDFEIRLGQRVVLAGQSDDVAWHESKALDLEFDYHPLTIRFRKTSGNARLALFWSGPQFQIEPIAERYFFHDPVPGAESGFERGALLVRAFRCSACHEISGEPERLPAPDLTHAAENFHHEWLVERLQVGGPAGDELRDSRMPHFGLSQEEAQLVADYLFSISQPVNWTPTAEAPAKAKSPRRNRRQEIDPLVAGERLLLTVGCLACHTLDGTHQAVGLFGGGNLTRIAEKRPSEFFDRWLADPMKVNADHRMPIFALTTAERKHLTAYLSTLGNRPPAADTADRSARAEAGRELVHQLGCANCHRLAGSKIVPRRSLTVTDRSGTGGCFGASDRSRNRPGFSLSSSDREAIATFVGELSRSAENDSASATQLIAEHNCLACHARGGARGLASGLPSLVSNHDHLAALVPAMTPPALDQVGDKLHRAALEAAIQQRGEVYRDYLLVKMPRFRLSDSERDRIIDHLIDADRIPSDGQEANSTRTKLDAFALVAAGRRLVTPDGFGCTSCHQVGSVLPASAPLNARGPSLSMCGDRVRKEWFDRFVANPARVVPALEMPSVRVAVRGVLADDLATQLNAVWDVVNEPGFEPPRPNPIRVVRHSGRHEDERAFALTDVIRTPSKTYLKPLLVGLPNRHNVLFDLETAQLSIWSIGDTGRQRTEGKTWFWETAGSTVLATRSQEADVSLLLDGRLLQVKQRGQFPTEIDAVDHTGSGITFRHRLHFDGRSAEGTTLRLEQQLTPLTRGEWSGFRRRIVIENAPSDSVVKLRITSNEAEQSTANQRVLRLRGGDATLRISGPAGAAWGEDGSVSVAAVPDGPTSVTIEYLTRLAVDHFTLEAVEPAPAESANLDVVPGFEVTRLPIRDELMPTGLAWRPNGELFIASLKGRVWLARDIDGDGLEEQVQPFSDEIPAPYGVAAKDDYVDVITKFALLRMFDDDGDGQVDRTRAVASGWGHTTDYHDWAVGLPQDATGNYYVALPCQQDDRSVPSAYLRGYVLRLVPRTPTPDNPHEYALEEITGGHRFPMGLALRSDGELFVTDNQGNYNPFNELNHVVRNRRFGFINKLERRSGFNPDLTPPAIDIPHPWTRSVNGICFLETPTGGDSAPAAGHFGPFEGHLLGSELDTQRLIRMTLHRVDGEFQGAAYPFSYEKPPSGEPFLGPLTCAVAPDGDIYIGGVRDSGWGGGNNIGEIARMRPLFEELPCGIAEVRAVPVGLNIRFTSPVDRQRAADPTNYSVATYTRISTPAYGGDDHDRRRQTVDAVRVADDARSVTIELTPLIAGHVYELRTKNLAPGEEMFFPAEAHYTMRRVPVAPRDSQGASVE